MQGIKLLFLRLISISIVALLWMKSDSFRSAAMVPTNHTTPAVTGIDVVYFISNEWVGSLTPINGLADKCISSIPCEWRRTDNFPAIKEIMHSQKLSTLSPGRISVGVYNVHSLKRKYKLEKPPICEIPTTFTLAESEESHTRYYKKEFQHAFRNFDGYSTTNPKSHVQRIYDEAFINTSSILPLKPFSELIKAGAYIASNCRNANAHRDELVGKVRQAGFRVDGLAKCMKSPDNPEGIGLPKAVNTEYDLTVKRKVINHFMFYFAFENALEPGYVTEKPFDA